ncbi:uncharacterized protein [Spinacia oleracea]|uniref:Uncharacterized protein LOC110782972 n=2 Tax=Spinacia oleracea TaxID=3562 RepID=A0A9R0I509_SPIOL|nr:uncharacterized protein LOC110782972 isoform X1 [Spinacia oleracea]XP_021842952.1 uncharacterized protein LOC110782972 isoform X1 [Spinacia oleracea]
METLLSVNLWMRKTEAFTDVYWIKFQLISNARFAKRKLDESVFLGNRLQVSYATEYESLSDTKEKLEGRRKEVMSRLKPGRSRGHEMQSKGVITRPLSHGAPSQVPQQLDLKPGGPGWYAKETDQYSEVKHSSITRVSSDQDYFPSQSMNETVRRVREKLDKIESSSSNTQSGPASKKTRVDNRRRI